MRSATWEVEGQGVQMAIAVLMLTAGMLGGGCEPFEVTREDRNIGITRILDIEVTPNPVVAGDTVTARVLISPTASTPRSGTLGQS